jgi:hypothetical protein
MGHTGSMSMGTRIISLRIFENTIMNEIRSWLRHEDFARHVLGALDDAVAGLTEESVLISACFCLPSTGLRLFAGMPDEDPSLRFLCSAWVSSMATIVMQSHQDPVMRKTSRHVFIRLPCGNALKCSR